MLQTSTSRKISCRKLVGSSWCFGKSKAFCEKKCTVGTIQNYQEKQKIIWKKTGIFSQYDISTVNFVSWL